MQFWANNTTRSMYVKNHVKKCVKNVCFSRMFHMFFALFQMYFTLIFRMCEKLHTETCVKRV